MGTQSTYNKLELPSRSVGKIANFKHSDELEVVEHYFRGGGGGGLGSHLKMTLRIIVSFRVLSKNNITGNFRFGTT